MAGHSQFKNIMHRKGRQDAVKSKLFGKLAREITVSAKLGLPDPGMNARLRAAILAARAENMSKDSIERAIKKASGGEAETYDEIRYEGYGPGGVAVIVEVLTDNRNRTAGEVRSTFTKSGGNLAETGAVSFMFDHLGVVEYGPQAASPDAMLEAAIEAGADAITLGNHAWDQREALVFIERAPRLVRPINDPPGTPGRGAALIETRAGAHVLVVNVMGRIFMDPLDDPFAAIDTALAAHPLASVADAVVVDVHCEATSEKQAMGHFCDGRASLVVGTHTHVPTADHQILPGGTGFISDVGMTGDYDSVIGMVKDEPLARFLHRIPGGRFEPALGEATLCAVAIETDDKTGLARHIAGVRLGGRLAPAGPAFWE